MSSLFIISPLNQFEVLNLIGIEAPIFGHLHINITNIALYSCLILFILITLHIYGNNEYKLIPSQWSIAFESSFASLSSMVREQIGLQSEMYLPFIYSLFVFILIGNLISNVPYSFAVTSSAIICLGLSFSIFTAVTILALFLHKAKFFSFFIPEGTPLALVPLLV
jgi:F-type H+-transporting ATPase subunit a